MLAIISKNKSTAPNKQFGASGGASRRTTWLNSQYFMLVPVILSNNK